MDPQHAGQSTYRLEVDLIKALEKRNGWPIEFKQFNFMNLAFGFNRGDIDLRHEWHGADA